MEREDLDKNGRVVLGRKEIEKTEEVSREREREKIINKVREKPQKVTRDREDDRRKGREKITKEK